MHLIPDEGAEALASISFSYEELDLSGNQIGPEGASHLSKAKIGFLNLSANPLTHLGVKYFSDTTTIKDISLSECEAGDDGAKAILQNNNFRTVDLSSNEITDEGVKQISGGSLENLNLKANNITEVGARFIAKHGSLCMINLAENRIAGQGLEPFALNKNLLILNLMHNKIDAAGFSNICQSPSLRVLELYDNKIRFGKNELLGLPSKSSLRKVGLGRNELNGTCIQVLQALASIKTLETLDLTSNDIDDKGAAILYAHKSSSLKEINLSNNPIQDLNPIIQGKKF